MHTTLRSTRITTTRALTAGLTTLFTLLAACGDGNDSLTAPRAALSKGAPSPTSGTGVDGVEIGGGKSCSGFSVRFDDGRVLSGKAQANLAGVSGSATVQGKFVSFTVDLATFKVTDYTMNGTTIFARKEALHGQALTQPIAVDLNNEQLVLQRATANGTLTMKIQAKDCNTGGVFQMEAESNVAATTTYEHELAPGFAYFDPNPATSRTFFSIGGTATGAFLGYDSPEAATRIAPALGQPVSGTIVRYAVQNGGRMGMVVGGDAQQGLGTP